MITGWELLEPARRQGARFVRAVVRFGDHAREVPLDQLEMTLEAQVYQTDFVLDDPESENARFDFVVWSADGTMWYRAIRDGLVELGSKWSTPESWLAAHGASLPLKDAVARNSVGMGLASDFVGAMLDAGFTSDEIDRHTALAIFGRQTDEMASGDEMPDDVADAIEGQVAERLQQLADAPGGRVVLDVGDLSPHELELIADSEIPSELRWTIEDVDRARAEITEIVDRLPPHLVERARDAVRDIDPDDLQRQYRLAEAFDLSGWRPPVALRGLGDLEYVPRPRPGETPAAYARRYWRFFWLRDRGQLVYEPGYMGIEMIGAGSLPREYRRAIDKQRQEDDDE